MSKLRLLQALRKVVFFFVFVNALGSVCSHIVVRFLCILQVSNRDSLIDESLYSDSCSNWLWFFFLARRRLIVVGLIAVKRDVREVT